MLAFPSKYIISIISLNNRTFPQNIFPILFYVCQNKQQSFLKSTGN